MELHIGKVVVGDRGNYRLEVKAKDVCDSCSFNIDVEGALVRGWGDQRVAFRLGRVFRPGVGGHTDVGV